MRAFDRLPSETMEEYELFLSYARQSPGSRDLRTVALNFGLPEEEVIAIAERNAWIERASAYDRFQINELERFTAMKIAEAKYYTMAALAEFMKKFQEYLSLLDSNHLALEEMKIILEWSERAARIANSLKVDEHTVEPDVEEVLSMARHLRQEIE